jgi:hypothetical protein
MMDEISLEDLARGITPKKNKKGEKPEPMSPAASSEVSKMLKIIDGIDSKSVKALKKLNKTDLKALCKAAGKTQDALYRYKEMLREAMPKEYDTMTVRLG